MTNDAGVEKHRSWDSGDSLKPVCALSQLWGSLGLLCGDSEPAATSTGVVMFNLWVLRYDTNQSFGVHCL